MTQESPPGYVWGVECQVLYPGARLIENSERAEHWQDQTGLDFHEVVIEGNAHEISIVFSELRLEEVREGYIPYRVVHEGDAERYAAVTKMPLSPES